MHKFILIFILFSASSAFACDVCAIYTAVGGEDVSENNWRVGIQEQFTAFEGERNNFKQSLDSSISQIAISKRISNSVLAEFSIPFVYRKYKRLESGRPVKGSETGFSDASILFHYQPYSFNEGGDSLFTRLFAGIKLPTGDSDRLREEAEEAIDERSLNFRHGGSGGSIVDGADIALGTGSFDFIFGASAFSQWGRYFLSGALQYTLTTEGDHNFEYGDNVIWSIGPGLFLYTEHENSLSLRCRLSGEYQDKDELHGDTLPESSIQRVYLGPELGFSIDQSWKIDLGVDFPIEVGNKSESVEPEVRFRLGVLHRF